jgi:hypothetical protein
MAGSGQPAAENGGAAWQRPVALAPGLSLANEASHSWLPGLGVVKDGAQRGAPLHSLSTRMKLGAENEAPAIGSGSSCSWWGG